MSYNQKNPKKLNTENNIIKNKKEKIIEKKKYKNYNTNNNEGSSSYIKIKLNKEQSKNPKPKEEEKEKKEETKGEIVFLRKWMKTSHAIIFRYV